jgi:SAM-dependent methyltransferase
LNLAEYYKRQFGWRNWPSILEALPPLQGCTILDLGCGVGDQAAELVARGARVIGIDMSEEVLQAARSRQLPNTELVDGIWNSFAAAYFPICLRCWRIGGNGSGPVGGSPSLRSMVFSVTSLSAPGRDLFSRLTPETPSPPDDTTFTWAASFKATWSNRASRLRKC